MKSVYEVVVEAICSVSAIDPSDVTPNKHIIDDLEVDSLDFLDITFEVDSALGIRLPLEDWLAGLDGDDRAKALIVQEFVAFVEATVNENAA